MSSDQLSLTTANCLTKVYTCEFMGTHVATFNAKSLDEARAWGIGLCGNPKGDKIRQVRVYPSLDFHYAYRNH